MKEFMKELWWELLLPAVLTGVVATVAVYVLKAVGI